MTEDFAKLYRDEEMGQILVVLDTNDDGKPAIHISINAEQFGFGICTSSLVYEDNDEGWDKAEKMFSEMDEEDAFDLSVVLYNQLKGVAEDEE